MLSTGGSRGSHAVPEMPDAADDADEQEEEAQDEGRGGQSHVGPGMGVLDNTNGGSVGELAAVAPADGGFQYPCEVNEEDPEGQD